MKKSLWLTTSTLGLLVSCVALADSTSATVAATPQLTTSVATESKASMALDQFTASFFGVYHGGRMSDPTSKYTLDHDGKLIKKSFNAQNLDTTVDLAYNFAPSIGVGAYVPFLLVPSQGQHFIIGDVGAELYDKKLIDRDGVRAGANFIVQTASSDYSKSRKMDAGLKIAPFAWYAIPHTSLKVGAWTDAKAYLGVASGKTFKVWTLPYVNYALTDSFSLNVAYEFEAQHLKGAPKALDLTTYQMDLQPGVVWRANKAITVNPFMQIFTANKLTSDNLALGATLSAKMF